MDLPQSQTQPIDLTGDDEVVVNFRPPVNPITTSRQNPIVDPRHAPKQLIPRSNLYPDTVDLTDDTEEIANPKKSAVVKGSVGKGPAGGAYTFFNRNRRTDGPQKTTVAWGGATHNPARNNDNSIRTTQPAIIRDVSHQAIDPAAVRENWQEFRKTNPLSFASTRGQSQGSNLQAQRQVAVAPILVRRPEPTPITPLKRKQSSTSNVPERPVFRSPQMATHSNNAVSNNANQVLSTTPQTILTSGAQSALVQRPKTISPSPAKAHPSPNSGRMPQARIFKSLSEVLASREDQPFSIPSNQLTSRDAPPIVSRTVADAAIPGMAGSDELPVGEEDESSELIFEESISPTSSAFPPGFDRGRYPKERRRRGGLGLPNPYTPRARYSKAFSDRSFSLDQVTAHVGSRKIEIERAPVSRNSSSAGQSRGKLGTQRSYLFRENPETLQSRLQGADAGDTSKPTGPLSTRMIPSLPNGLLQPLIPQSCSGCALGDYPCDHVMPTCGRCVRLHMACRYDTAVQKQIDFGRPIADFLANQKIAEQRRPSVVPLPHNSQQLNNSDRMFDSSKANHIEGSRNLSFTVVNSRSSDVRVKQEDSDEEDPNLGPDYLDTTKRTRGWHHDGYADVKDLFKRIAMDVVIEKSREYTAWPLDLDLTTSIVKKKAEDWANKKFGYFVTRLAMSTGSSTGSAPNANDVEWIQRKVSETFLEEATRATCNTADSPPGSARAEGAIAIGDPAFSSYNSGETEKSESENRRTRSSGPLPSQQKDTRSNSQTSLDLSHEASLSEIHQQNFEPKVATRPSRAAAGAAASRITSQYMIYGSSHKSPVDAAAAASHITQRSIHEKPSKSGESRTGKVFDRQHCDYCDCEISVHNWGVHAASLKHKDNVKRKPAATKVVYDRRHCEYCDCKISVLNWGAHIATQKHRDNFNREVGEVKTEARPANSEKYELSQKVIEDLESAPALGSLPMADHLDKSLHTVKLQPQMKPVRGVYLQSLAASLAILERNSIRPYQGKKKRGMIDKDARLGLLMKQSILRHVDFTAEEMAIIKKTLAMDQNGVVNVTASLANAYASELFQKQERDWLAIKARIQCLDDGPQDQLPKFSLIESRVKDPNIRPACHIGSLLRHRELGSSAIGRNVEARSELKNRLAEAIKPWRSFRGASHDVVTVAWASNSMDFAAGAAAHSNPEDLQYNRPCNLLFGDLRRNNLTELPDHHVDRQTLDKSFNSSQDMVNSCDPKVYKTVFSVKFHPSGDQMYTASEDQTVKVWKLSESRPRCLRTIKHNASVTGLDLSPSYPGVIATASRNISNAIQVFDASSDEGPKAQFSSTRALMKPEWRLYPESLLWGPSVASGHLLLAGFNADNGGENENPTEGHLCLWDVTTLQDLKPTPSSQAIHTVVWHPTLPYFVTGGAPGFDKTNKLTTKTVVRAWDYRYVKRLTIEYECPALEMTDVTFHPLNHNIATAGCTDAVSYVWDFRWPDQPLHSLRHGKSIMPTGVKDTGVMMSLWGTGNSLYYSGSSDGEIRAWDIRRHPNDALVDTVARVDGGIQSGSFSPDGTHLLVGDATGGIHVLSSAPWGPGPNPSVGDDIGTPGVPMDIVRTSDNGDEGPGTEGIEAARDLVRSGQVVLDRVYGPGKGPYYNEPWANNDREPSTTSVRGKLNKPVYKQQAFNRLGEERPEWATPIRELAAARKEKLDPPKEENFKIPRKTPLAPDTPGSPHPQPNLGQILTPILTSGLNQTGHCSSRGSTSSPTKWTGTTTPISRMLDRASETPSVGSPKRFAVRSQKSPIELGAVDNVIPESEMIEDNDWWPRLGEEEIAAAHARPHLRHD